MNEKMPCVICTKETTNRFNINFDAVPICESCANAIAIQQVTDLVMMRDNDEQRRPD